jgi:hypothetical protein
MGLNPKCVKTFFRSFDPPNKRFSFFFAKKKKKKIEKKSKIKKNLVCFLAVKEKKKFKKIFTILRGAKQL